MKRLLFSLIVLLSSYSVAGANDLEVTNEKGDRVTLTNGDGHGPCIILDGKKFSGVSPEGCTARLSPNGKWVIIFKPNETTFNIAIYAIGKDIDGQKKYYVHAETKNVRGGLVSVTFTEDGTKATVQGGKNTLTFTYNDNDKLLCTEEVSEENKAKLLKEDQYYYENFLNLSELHLTKATEKEDNNRNSYQQRTHGSTAVQTTGQRSTKLPYVIGFGIFALGCYYFLKK